MSKKKLILIPALLLALTSCGPTTNPESTPNPSTDPTVSVDPSTDPTVSNDPTTQEAVVTGVEITNKAEFADVWYVGDADKNVNYVISYSDGTQKARGATITSSDTNVVSLPGGVKVHAAGAGTATITVTMGEFTDSVEVTVAELSKEETVTVAELLEKPVNDATAYTVSGYIVSWQSGKDNATPYGNFIIADAEDASADAGILVYGATEHEDSLSYDETAKIWSWKNPNSEEPKRPFPYENYKIGDKVTMKGLRFDYGSTKEFNGLVIEHVEKQLEEVTSVEWKTKTTSIGNGYSFKFVAQDNNQTEDVTYSLTGTAATLDGSTVIAHESETGKVTLTAKSNSKPEISASIDIEIVANPEIINATLEDVINDEGTKGAKLWRIEAKTVANSSTKEGDQYGNFDYTDGTNTITSYGLSASPSSISYYGNAWNFKNDKTFDKTGVEVGSDKTYTVVVMRSDYKGTKQLVGYIEQTFNATYKDVTVEEFIAAEPSNEVAYNVKGYIKSYYKSNTDATKYVNFELASSMDAESITVYGASKEVTALAYDKYLNTFTFTNPKNANPDDYMIGDYVEMTLLRTVHTDYNNNTFQQAIGIITKHVTDRAETISIIGSFNGGSWDTDVEFTGSKGGKFWELNDVEFKANDEFKVRRDKTWSSETLAGYDWGFANVTVGNDLVTDNNSNIKIKEDGKYNITFNFETKSISIFKQVTESADAVTATKSVADLIKEYGWTSSTTKQSFNLDDNVSVKIDGGSNTGKAYEDDHIRIYATDTPAGTITISVPEGYELVKIKISTKTGTYAFLYVDGATEDISNVETTVSGSSVKLNSVKNGTNGKQVRVTAFEVTYQAK